MNRSEGSPGNIQFASRLDATSAPQTTARADSLFRIVRSAKKTKSSDYLDTGRFPVVDQGRERIAGYSNDGEAVVSGPVILFGDHTRILKYLDFLFVPGADGTQLLAADEGVDPRFLFYALHTVPLETKGYERHFKYLREAEIPRPPFPIQERIGAFLGSFDQLIDNCRERIDALQNITQSVFAQWFSSQTEMSSEHIDSMAKIAYGRNLPKSKMDDAGDYPVYGAAKIIGRHSEYDHAERTIVVGCRGTVGQVQITEPKCYITNNSFSVVPLIEADFFWLFQELKRRGFSDIVGGSAQPQITLDGMAGVKLEVPGAERRAQYGEMISPMWELSWNLGRQIAELSAARDLLLPGLISGEIELNVAREVPEAAAE